MSLTVARPGVFGGGRSNYIASSRYGRRQQDGLAWINLPLWCFLGISFISSSICI